MIGIGQTFLMGMGKMRADRSCRKKWDQIKLFAGEVGIDQIYVRKQMGFVRFLRDRVGLDTLFVIKGTSQHFLTLF